MRDTKLYRSRRGIFGGVCGGFADYLGWDRALVRILYVIFSILSAAFPGTIVYIVLWIVMPKAAVETIEQSNN